MVAGADQVVAASRLALLAWLYHYLGCDVSKGAYWICIDERLAILTCHHALFLEDEFCSQHRVGVPPASSVNDLGMMLPPHSRPCPSRNKALGPLMVPGAPVRPVAA